MYMDVVSFRSSHREAILGKVVARVDLNIDFATSAKIRSQSKVTEVASRSASQRTRQALNDLDRIAKQHHWCSFCQIFDIVSADDVEKSLHISGRENLGTMALVDAAYRSSLEHRSVPLAEITDANLM